MILYAFKFLGGYVFEVRWDGIPDTAPKSERYQWIVVDGRNRVRLDFDRMDESTRYFKDGTELDITDRMVMYFHGYVHGLEPCTDQDKDYITKNLIPNI